MFLQLAKDITNDLGRSYHLKMEYRFAIPEDERLAEGIADAAIFSSPVPSIYSAAIGFVSTGRFAGENFIDKLGYLGAPLVIVHDKSDLLQFYTYKGLPKAEKVDEIKVSGSSSWVRERIVKSIESPQLHLNLNVNKQLLLQETTFALASVVRQIMKLAAEDLGIADPASFGIAISIIRKVLFDEALSQDIPARSQIFAERLAQEIKPKLSFQNIPPESVAELYESLAIDASSRRRKGVVYTPSWLARYIVSRIPLHGLKSLAAVDPTCGSGTFLVCFLERYIEELAKIGVDPPSNLSDKIIGYDIDPVAVEAARLSLDIFAKTIGFPKQTWNIKVADATEGEILGDWIIGNLPFGYRTHEGRHDLSSAIVENMESGRINRHGISIILPHSFAYTKIASKSRELLREHYQIQEITCLPEATFEGSSAQTIVVIAQKGDPSRQVLVREVHQHDIRSFKAGAYVSKSYISQLPLPQQDPWRFTPFNNAIQLAESNSFLLGSVADIHMGLQIYGVESDAFRRGGHGDNRPLLTDPSLFARWSEGSVNRLPKLTIRSDEVRRKGPWDKFPESKVIVRVTTAEKAFDRLAAIPDNNGVWFTDKFAGIWLKGADITLEAIAAYLQTRFARLWFDSNNPSRKLRIKTLEMLPLPKLPAEWWKKAESLAPSNRVVRPPKETPDGLKFSESSLTDWVWFNSAIETAFGFSPSTKSEIEKWFADRFQ